MRHSRNLYLLVLVVTVAVSVFSQSLSIAQTPEKAVSYDDVKKLAQSGLDEGVILTLLEKTPTTFILSDEQEQELRSLNVSEKVIAALKGKRSGGTPVRELNDLAIVLDCSGSMAEQTSDGQIKMDVAKKVVIDLIERIPDSLHVTFIVYGHDKVNACSRVKVARPLSQLDSSGKAGLKTFIAQLQPVSKTPIALSLDTARQELAKRDAKCGLILISDGKETCGGDPQGEAKKLVEQLNCTFGVNVVAFNVDEEGTQQLREVAETGDGRFYEAANTAELQKAIGGLVTEVEESAEDPAVDHTKSSLTRLKVKPWNLKGFPKLKKIEIYKTGSSYHPYDYPHPVQSMTDFSTSTVVTAGEYDIWYRAEGQSRPVKLGVFELPEKTEVNLNTNKLVAGILVKLESEGLPQLELISAYSPGSYKPDYTISGLKQSVDQYSKPLLVTADAPHDVYLKLEGAKAVPLAKKITVKGGEVHVIGE